MNPPEDTTAQNYPMNFASESSKLSNAEEKEACCDFVNFILNQKASFSDPTTCVKNEENLGGELIEEGENHGEKYKENNSVGNIEGNNNVGNIEGNNNIEHNNLEQN